MGNVLKRYNGTNWEAVGGTITGDTLPIGSEVDYTGTDIPAGWEEVESYSTDEIDTGKVWVDGKPIYRKVFTGTTANAEYTEITHSFETITNFSGYFTDGNWVNLLPFYIYISPDEKFMCFYGNPTTSKIYLQYSSAYRNKNYSLVVEYTKSS